MLLSCFINFIYTVSEAKEEISLPKFIYDGRTIDAKAIGLGEAFVAVSDNPSAMYWNPAGLKQIEKKYFATCLNVSRKSDAGNEELFANDSLKDRNLIFMGFVGPNGAFAFKPITDYEGVFDGKEIEIRANKYSFSSASQYAPNLVVGVNLNYISAQLGVIDRAVLSTNISDGNGASADVGLLYTVSDNMKLGLNVENFPGYIWWSDYKYQKLKIHLRTGISINPVKWLLLTGDYENIDSIKKEYCHYGMQQAVTQHLFLREGIINEKFSEKSYKKTYGVGYEIKDWIMDFATGIYKLDNAAKDKVTDYIFSLNIPI